MTDFKDTKLASAHVLRISKCRNALDLVKYVNSVLPNWIYDVADQFDSDLKPLTDNWHNVCKRVNVKPKTIILVEKVIFENDEDVKSYRVLTTALNHLTKHGYCVREKSDFTMCLTEGCNSVMLCKQMRNNLFKQKKCSRPFTNLCIDCLKSMNTK